MLKRSITYTDFKGVERTEDFRFHLSEAELIEMDLRQKGGLEDYLNKIIQQMDGAGIIDFFKNFIMKSYGEISDDGRKFIKSDEISNGFLCSAAYPVLFNEFMEGGDAATKFITALVPKPKKAT